MKGLFGFDMISRQVLTNGIEFARYNSSLLRASTYTPSTRTLRIEFMDGAKYEYYPITAQIYNELKESGPRVGTGDVLAGTPGRLSSGQVFWRYIRRNPGIRYRKL